MILFIRACLQGGSYEGEWRGGDREGMGIRTLRSGKVLAGMYSGFRV